MPWSPPPALPREASLFSRPTDAGAARERERFADGLHDDVLPLLFALRQDLQEIGTAETDARIVQLDDITRVLRATIHDEHPVLAERADLTEALWAAAAPACGRAALELAVDVELDGCVEPTEHRSLTLACVRELAGNAARHAHASRLRVHVLAAPQSMLVTVIDDGIGLDVRAPGNGRRPGHLGLSRLEHDVRGAGGSTLFRGDAGGTTVTVRLPLTT